MAKLEYKISYLTDEVYETLPESERVKIDTFTFKLIMRQEEKKGRSPIKYGYKDGYLHRLISLQLASLERLGVVGYVGGWIEHPSVSSELKQSIGADYLHSLRDLEYKKLIQCGILAFSQNPDFFDTKSKLKGSEYFELQGKKIYIELTQSKNETND